MAPVIFAIDPGPERSAYAVLRDDGSVEAATVPSGDISRAFAWLPNDAHVVIEMIASYGMPVGREVFETCVWIGRFLESWHVITTGQGRAHRLTRLQVKSAICHSAKANDANIRAALIDLFGGPACIRKGGPLYRVKGDEWAALAVAVTYRQLLKETGTHE